MIPNFNCPFSTTIALTVAHRFSKGKGLILKMKPSTSTGDKYLNVEWLSAFGELEKERLFVRANNLLIADIQPFCGGKRISIGSYVNAFNLFYSLFGGYYIGRLLKGR